MKDMNAVIADARAPAGVNQQGHSDPTVAFDQIYRDYSELVRRLCLRMLRDPVDAEDATQDAFLRVLLKLHTFRGESALSSWLYRLTTNHVLMQFRKNAHEHISLDDLGDDNMRLELGGPDLQLNGVLDRIDLQAALDQLPEGYRAAFVLYDIQGFDHKEVARICGYSVGNSKSQLHKARKRLRELLNNYYGERVQRKPSENAFARRKQSISGSRASSRRESQPFNQT